MASLACGRFAPSPSGPLHFGSLVAALGSFLIAKSKQARWQVRIEDIDPPREVEGASDTILSQLEAFALYWDGPVSYQSQRLEYYEQIVQQLKEQQLIYSCDCTRKTIQQASLNQLKQGLYPNICADKQLSFDTPTAIRLRHGTDDYGFEDKIQGVCQFSRQLYQEDFTIKRKDGLFAYQLAVVADDIAQGIDHVVRGCDLLDSTPRQLRLYQVLSSNPPQFYHLPLAINSDGNKLSKQNHAKAISKQDASNLLLKALAFLGQAPTNQLTHATPEQVIKWAIDNFSIEQIPKKQQILVDNND